MFLFTYFSPSSQSPMMTLSFVIIVIIAALASPHAPPRFTTCFASPYAPVVKYLYTALRTHPRSRFNASKTALSLV
jgi:hypothetical protein